MAKLPSMVGTQSPRAFSRWLECQQSSICQGDQEQAADAAQLQLTYTAIDKPPARLSRCRQPWVELPAQLKLLA